MRLTSVIIRFFLAVGVATGAAFAAPGAAAPKPKASAKTKPSRTVRRNPISYADRAKQVDDVVAQYSGLPVRSIEVKGLKRIEKDAVLGKFTTKVGSTIAGDSLRADVQSLFNMGYFDDIQVEGDRDGIGAKLVLTLHERPVISKIEFDGNERLSTSDLEGVIKIKEWSILDLNKVKEDVDLITKHYEEKGFYLAKVGFEVTSSDKPDEVALRYKINDYDKVEIKKIIFLGNKAFSDEQLKNIFAETKEGGFFGFLSNSGSFKESAFKTDLQRLTYWYLDHGYVKFKYDNPIVTVSEDKRWLYVTVSVDEGQQYAMGNVDFSGDLLFTRAELGEPITLKAGETFSISKRNLDIQTLSEKYQDLGYAFVNVVPKMNIRDDVKVVDIDYGFEKGSLAYFGEINVSGNTKTHDKVIRRELKIREGELYNGTRLRQSRENVERLGYFQPGEVLFNTATPKGRTDVVNVDVQIKERPTGTITLGAGYGSVKGLFFQTQVSEMNLFGKGQSLNLATTITRDRRDKSLSLGFTDPYAFDTRWSMGGQLYYTTFYIPSKYTTRKFGGNVQLGYPIWEYTNAYITYKRENMKIEDTVLDNPSPADLADIQADTGLLSSFVWSVVRDKRNNRMEPTKGNYQSVSIETAGLGGDKDFLKFDVNNRIYTPVIGDLVFRNSLEYAQANGYNGKVVPPSERFYLGGPNNLKGYPFYGVGPTRHQFTASGEAFDEPIGGNYEVVALFELEHPIVKEAGLKFVVFYDAGNVYTTADELSNFKLQTDWGFGFRWFSPIGPLRFEWGFPINPRPGDETSQFQFFIGPPF